MQQTLRVARVGLLTKFSLRASCGSPLQLLLDVLIRREGATLEAALQGGSPGGCSWLRNVIAFNHRKRLGLKIK
jgi:hypothetical protein